MLEVASSNIPVFTTTCDPVKSLAQHHSNMKPGSKLIYFNIGKLLLSKLEYSESV